MDRYVNLPQLSVGNFVESRYMKLLLGIVLILFVDKALLAYSDSEMLIRSVEIWLGTPYRWGGNDLDGIDCSHFVHRAYSEAGYVIPAPPTYNQIDKFRMTGKCIKDFGDTLFSMESLHFGDLIYYRWSSDSKTLFCHVWLVLDGDVFIHSNYPEGVAISPTIYFDDDPENIFIARPVNFGVLTDRIREAIEYLVINVDYLVKLRANSVKNIVPLAREARKRKLTLSDLRHLDAWSLSALYHCFDAFHNIPMPEKWLDQYFLNNLEGYTPRSGYTDPSFTKIEQRNRLFTKTYMCNEGFIPPPVVPKREVRSMERMIAKFDNELEDVLYTGNFGVISLAQKGRTICLSHDDLQGLSSEQLCLLRNAFYAFYNRPFRKEWIQEYFMKNLPGYNPNGGNWDIKLTEIEFRNVLVIQSFERNCE